jgi:hypothetical protein
MKTRHPETSRAARSTRLVQDEHLLLQSSRVSFWKRDTNQLLDDGLLCHTAECGAFTGTVRHPNVMNRPGATCISVLF